MRVVLTGAKGMLAQALIKHAPGGWGVQAFGKDALDITVKADLQEMVRRIRPEIIINCASFTDVDQCEANKDLAFAVNGAGAGYLAEGAMSVGARFVHFSTDYIFEGTQTRPYKEDDPACPLNVYGASKWEGECRVREKGSDHLIVRTQWLYGNRGDHFVKTILKLAQKDEVLKVVNDQIGSPTWTEDLSGATWSLIKKGSLGTYHIVNRGECSRYLFACRILEEAGIRKKVVPCKSTDDPRPAKRPAYSALSTEKAEAALGRSLPSWESALKRFFSEAR